MLQRQLQNVTLVSTAQQDQNPPQNRLSDLDITHLRVLPYRWNAQKALTNQTMVSKYVLIARRVITAQPLQ
jgi:hypothetical protein